MKYNMKRVKELRDNLIEMRDCRTDIHEGYKLILADKHRLLLTSAIDVLTDLLEEDT